MFFAAGALRDGHLTIADRCLRVSGRSPRDEPTPGPRICGLPPRDRPPKLGFPAPAQHLREPHARQQKVAAPRPPASPASCARHCYTFDDGGRALRLEQARAAFAFARCAPSAARADDAAGFYGPMKMRARGGNVHFAARAFSALATSPRVRRRAWRAFLPSSTPRGPLRGLSYVLRVPRVACMNPEARAHDRFSHCGCIYWPLSRYVFGSFIPVGPTVLYDTIL